MYIYVYIYIYIICYIIIYGASEPRLSVSIDSNGSKLLDGSMQTVRHRLGVGGVALAATDCQKKNMVQTMGYHVDIWMIYVDIWIIYG